VRIMVGWNWTRLYPMLRFSISVEPFGLATFVLDCFHCGRNDSDLFETKVML
jgi:hypothetical protein